MRQHQELQEELYEEQLKHKIKRLGNMKFVGQL